MSTDKNSEDFWNKEDTLEEQAELFWREVRRLEIESLSLDPIIEYRLYYNEKGDIIGGFPFVTNKPSEETPPEGNYIVVDHYDYKNSGNKVVIDGRLEKKKIIIDMTSQLVKSETGQKVVKNSAALLLDDDEQYPETEFYERRTS